LSIAKQYGIEQTYSLLPGPSFGFFDVFGIACGQCARGLCLRCLGLAACGLAQGYFTAM